MKKKNPQKQKENAAPPSNPSLTTLGEVLQERDPELARRFSQFHSARSEADQVLKVFNELFPCSWADPSLLAEGVNLLCEGREKGAHAVFQEIQRQNPQTYFAHHLMGLLCGFLGTHNEELEHYKKAIKLKPDYPQIYCDQGLAYWMLGKDHKALESFKQAVFLGGDVAVLDYWLTLNFDRLGRFKGRNGNGTEEGQEEHRILAHAYYLLGTSYVEFGLHTAARSAFKEAVRVKPDFAEAYYQLGALHTKKLRNPKRAVKYLEKAEKLFVKQNDLHRAGLAHLLLRPKDEAGDKEKIAEDWLKEGLRLQSTGRYQGAVDAYREAVWHQRDFLDAYYNMGIAYGCLQDSGIDRIDKAISAFRASIRLKPDFIHAYTALGASYIRQHQLEEAIEVLQEAVKIDPNNHMNLYYLGMAYQRSGDMQEAIDVLKKAAALKPDSIQTHYSLGLLFLDLSQPQDAVQSFQEAVRVKPDFADGHFMLGRLYGGELKENEKAVFHLKKAEKLFTKLEDHAKLDQVRRFLQRQ